MSQATTIEVGHGSAMSVSSKLVLTSANSLKKAYALQAQQGETPAYDHKQRPFMPTWSRFMVQALQGDDAALRELNDMLSFWFRNPKVGV